MSVKKNDFDQDLYVQKVDLAHDKLKKIESRLEKIENLTDASLLLKIFKKDTDLRDELEKLIWQTLKNKAWKTFFWLAGAAIVIPIVSKLFSLFMLHVFNVQF